MPRKPTRAGAAPLADDVPTAATVAPRPSGTRADAPSAPTRRPRAARVTAPAPTTATPPAASVDAAVAADPTAGAATTGNKRTRAARAAKVDQGATVRAADEHSPPNPGGDAEAPAKSAGRARAARTATTIQRSMVAGEPAADGGWSRPGPDAETVLARLRPVYGEMRWRPHHDAMTELILTILSQHTNDTLSGKAFARLLATFPHWAAIAAAPLPAVEEAIRDGGLARQKAPRIQAVLRQIAAERGRFDLGHLADLPLDEAKAWLQRLPGVGPKTAACVLMFALGRPALPVDTHVYRVSKRLGLIAPTLSEARAHDALEPLVPPDDTYAFHVALIKHGRHTCMARKPACHACPLRDLCPAAFHAEPAPAAEAGV